MSQTEFRTLSSFTVILSQISAIFAFNRHSKVYFETNLSLVLHGKRWTLAFGTAMKILLAITNQVWGTLSWGSSTMNSSLLAPAKLCWSQTPIQVTVWSSINAFFALHTILKTYYIHRRFVAVPIVCKWGGCKLLSVVSLLLAWVSPVKIYMSLDCEQKIHVIWVKKYAKPINVSGFFYTRKVLWKTPRTKLKLKCT